MQTYDTHAHIDHLENFATALTEAAEAGVIGIMAMSMDLASMKRNLEIRQQAKAPEIFVGLGIHPGEIKSDQIEESLAFIRSNISQAQYIGEIGMDFWYKWVKKDEEKKKEQREVFRRQLAIAKEFDRPVIVHSRGTWRECLDMVREQGIKKANFHWYSGPVDVLQDIMKSGYYVSASPALAMSPQSREAIRHAAIEQTLIETDCPVFYRYRDTEGGFTAQPKDVFKTLAAYAELKGMKEEEALPVLTRNARNFFGI